MKVTMKSTPAMRASFLGGVCMGRSSMAIGFPRVIRMLLPIRLVDLQRQLTA